jgi:nucleoside-diphosphate-sugar epimerase
MARLSLCLLFAHAAVLISSGVFANAMTVSKVAVVGATGRLGRLTVQQLVDQGIECKILSRKKPDVALKELPKDATSAQVAAYLSSLPGVAVVQGDVGNVEALQELCSDCQACIAVYGATRRSQISDLWKHPEDEDPTHAKQVNYQGVQNLIQACKATNCKRIVRITGKGEDPNGIFSVLINMLGSMAKAWNYEGERALRGQSDIDYTIIRPGIMSEEGPGDDGASSLSLADDGQDLPLGKIAYADIASLCIECLDYDNAARTTLTAMTTTTTTTESSSGEKTSWKPMLATVQPDRRSFPDDMLEQHYAAVRNALFKLGGVLALVLAVLAKLIFF